MNSFYFNKVFIQSLIIIGMMIFHAEELLAEPSPPIQPNLSIDILPPLGKTAQLTCEITSIVDVEVTANIELPPDTRVLDGTLNWKGGLAAHETVQFSVSVIFETEGDKEIYCRVEAVDSTPSELAPLYLSVGQLRTWYGYSPTPCEIADSFANPSESDSPGFPASSCFDYGGIWQDENEPDNYYSIYRNENVLIMIELSLLDQNEKSLMAATYMGTKENYVYILAPLAPSPTIDASDETRISAPSVEITFTSNTKAVITPLCAICNATRVNIHKIFSNVEKERIGQGPW